MKANIFLILFIEISPSFLWMKCSNEARVYVYVCVFAWGTYKYPFKKDILNGLSNMLKWFSMVLNPKMPSDHHRYIFFKALEVILTVSMFSLQFPNRII